MVSDDSTIERADNNHKNHAKIEAGLDRWSQQEFDRRLRVAAIGYRVPISKLSTAELGEDLRFLAPQDDTPVVSNEAPLPTELGRTTLAEKADIHDWHDAISALARRTLDRQSRIIVIPEFCLPPRNSRSIAQDLRNACSNAALDYFFFAGTRHEDRYNRGLILSKRHGKTSIHDHWHYKAASARGLGENVLGRAGTTALSYETSVMFNSDEMRVAIAICYDTYDPTTFLNVFLDAVRNQEARRPRIVLVPSFNPSPDFVALLRDLSFLARCAVVYVNGLNGDAEGFMCGFSLSDFDRRPDGIVETLLAREGALKGEINNLIAGALDPNKVKQLSRKRTQLKEVEILRGRIETLKLRGALDHIITFEDCPHCATPGALHTHRLCYRDIQYYNLDLALLSALFDFRRFYFLDEPFLPDPLRAHNLQTSAALLQG
ncbi:hypothetical protein [Bradyrhizobium sp. CCBAU 45384]|uniref:hypothetical protein n=1 Tax=Bradyrhizobium sp. CCBAU 45384 TaxID=858428 RepID=UPI0023050DF2|nr:hypothetical protein [Bradyrhizobium sp. CCBAU 45384]